LKRALQKTVGQKPEGRCGLKVGGVNGLPSDVWGKGGMRPTERRRGKVTILREQGKKKGDASTRKEC